MGWVSDSDIALIYTGVERTNDLTFDKFLALVSSESTKSAYYNICFKDLKW